MRGARFVNVAVATVVVTVAAGGAWYLAEQRERPVPASARSVPVDTASAVTPSTTRPRANPVPGAQRTLRELGYQVREVTGELDARTRHAVVAFQKVHGLARTGELDAATLGRLDTPTTPRPESTDPGFHLEVDLGRQVVFTVRDGTVDRIHDASTGRPGKATPPGDYRMRYQIDGMRYAPLGPMYRPSYFTTTGLAIHGGEPVETRAASNGCVRLTNPSIDELFPRLGPGTRVLIY
ncbi:L,D-transpeptidase family protein [Amycolatopsis cihanbeyliensis]|uniref:Lipoprotein-anchoring transpeptidase ErfK/SrfK n=1 Tax=Amycolatopsis cihanbeyliensis TaxID=1128664 RepID=A0A542CUY3_AMYCI|nr:L,D-transpeptidase family protein [Amycolatopsis cihanbeyliensis]TQI94632.1 lipoprotein-anchoring transpeptidase ErfK/SrfK [Amycolatopsis cihanbeyliensis]